MPNTAFFGVVAGIIALASFVLYIQAILAGETKPARSSWIVWSAVSTILLFSYWQVGGGTALWVSIVTLAGTLLITLLTFKYGVGGWTKLDRACLAGCAVALGLWWLTNSALIALCAAIASEAMGSVVTAIKTWHHPEQEDRLAWRLGFAANCLNLGAVEKWDFAHAAYPIYFVLWFAVMVIIISRRESRES